MHRPIVSGAQRDGHVLVPILEGTAWGSALRSWHHVQTATKGGGSKISIANEFWDHEADKALAKTSSIYHSSWPVGRACAREYQKTFKFLCHQKVPSLSELYRHDSKNSLQIKSFIFCIQRSNKNARCWPGIALVFVSSAFSCMTRFLKDHEYSINILPILTL